MEVEETLVKCEYLRQKHNYATQCGFRAAYNKFWKLCPYCGRSIHVINKKWYEER